MASLVKPFAAIGLVIACLSANSASADTYRHIDDMAREIERKAKKIVSETRHYRHTPEYRHLLSDAKDIRDLADDIHDLARDHGCLNRLAADVNELNVRLHHLRELFDRIECRASRGDRYIQGDTRHVKVLLNAIAECIRYLQDDLRTLRAPTCDLSRRSVARPVYPAPRPVFSAPPARYSVPLTRYSAPPTRSWNGYSGRGITFGSGNAQFSIRF